MEMNILFQGGKEALENISKDVKKAGGRAWVVGGAVRDFCMGIPVDRELDIEVFNLAEERLETILKKRFHISSVGKSFSVFKLHNLPIDVSLPRREIKTGASHQDFEIQADPTMSLKEAASRRDFTINAISYDPLNQEIIDPLQGKKDIEKKILRHCSERFSEDPLRVLRAMQFSARFSFHVSTETIEFCKKIPMENLPKERIFEEWKKLIILGRMPSYGLSFLKDCGWIKYFPELKLLINCKQEHEWHPEGDVWIHTLHCMDAFAEEKIGDEWEDLIVGFAVLCHDFGKPATTKFEDGRIRSKGHEKAGKKPTKSFLTRMIRQQNIIDQVLPLVTHHLRPHDFWKQKAGDSAIRRLARKIGRIDRLVRVARADHKGRPPLPFDGFPAGVWLTKKAHALEVEDQKPKPLLLGRHLLQIGLSPGPSVGKTLKKCFEAQLEGKFSDIEGGINFAKTILKETEDF